MRHQLLLAKSGRTLSARYGRSAHSGSTARYLVRRPVSSDLENSALWANRRRPVPAAVVCAAAAEAEAESTTQAEQQLPVEGAGGEKDVQQKPQRKAQGRLAKGRRGSGVLMVGERTQRTVAAGYASNFLMTKGLMKGSAFTEADGPSLLKAVALTNMYLKDDGRCAAITKMTEGEQKNLEVEMSLAAKQDLDGAEPLRVAGGHRVDVTRNIIVGRVTNNKPISLLAAGPRAITVATRSLMSAQQRLTELGFYIAVVPSFVDVVRDANVDSMERAAAAAEPSTFDNGKPSARSSLKLHVVLVSNPINQQPPAPSTTRDYATKQSKKGKKARVLSSVNLDESSKGEAWQSPEQFSGPVILEVNRSVERKLLAQQIKQELQAKGSVQLVVQQPASGLCLQSIHLAGTYLADSTDKTGSIICDIATSTRNGAFLINLTLDTAPTPFIPILPPTTPPSTPSASADSASAPVTASTSNSADSSTDSNSSTKASAPAVEASGSAEAFAASPEASESESGTPDGPYGGFLRIGQASEVGVIADMVFKRCQTQEGRCAMRMTFGIASEVALAALVQARDMAQTRSGRDLLFRVDTSKIELKGSLTTMCCLYVGSRPLQ